MTRKIKTTLLTAFFIFGLLTGLHAQDKYEYANIFVTNAGSVSGGSKGKLCISTATEYQEIEFKVDKGNMVTNTTFVLDYINKMAADGWDVFETVSPSYYDKIFYLRKRKN